MVVAIRNVRSSHANRSAHLLRRRRLESRRNRDAQAHEDQQRGELKQQLARVALRVRREQLAIDDAEEELAIEHAKLLSSWHASAQRLNEVGDLA